MTTDASTANDAGRAAAPVTAWLGWRGRLLLGVIALLLGAAHLAGVPAALTSPPARPALRTAAAGPAPDGMAPPTGAHAPVALRLDRVKAAPDLPPPAGEEPAGPGLRRPRAGAAQLPPAEAARSLTAQRPGAARAPPAPLQHG